MELEDIYKKIQAEIDKGNIHSLDEINALAGKLMTTYNNAPREDAEGLSPTQLHQLLGLLFNEGTMITLNPGISDELAMTSPFLQICLHILKAIPEDKPLKLTATGALPRWLVQEVYETKVLPSYYIENGFMSLQKELDWSHIHTARLVCELAGLARKGKGKEKVKWYLTRKGKKLLNKPGEMLEVLFSTYHRKFNWAYLDNYPSETAAQLSFGFTLFLLHKFGKTYRNVEFYADKTLTAFPMEANAFETSWFRTAAENYFRCYSHRTFNRCLHTFGLVKLKETGKKYTDSFKEEVCATPLFKAFINVNKELPAAEESDNIKQHTPEKNSFLDSGQAFPGQAYPGRHWGFNPSFGHKAQPAKLPGRNDPCPCGSGRKYKNCCLQ